MKGKGLEWLRNITTVSTASIILAEKVTQHPDERGPMMWIFHPKVADLRRTHKIVVKIKSHVSQSSVGRNADVCEMEAAPRHPLDPSKPATVEIEHSNNSQNVVREEVDVNSLTLPARLNSKGLNVVIDYDSPYFGEIVQHKRTIKENAHVTLEMDKSNVILRPAALNAIKKV